VPSKKVFIEYGVLVEDNTELKRQKVIGESGAVYWLLRNQRNLIAKEGSEGRIFRIDSQNNSYYIFERG
jgi:hypothetical protein